MRFLRQFGILLSREIESLFLSPAEPVECLFPAQP